MKKLIDKLKAKWKKFWGSIEEVLEEIENGWD